MKILRSFLLLCLSLCLKYIASDRSHVLYSAFLQNRLTLQQPRPSATASLDNNRPTGIRDRKCLKDRSRYLLKLRGGELAPAYFNVGVSVVILAETVVWLKIWTELAKRELLPSTLTRKIIHSASAPLFILHWPLFARDPSGRIVAALIPLLQIFRLLYAGLFSSPKTSASDGNPSHAGNELVAAVSRTGNRREALGGPLIYSIVLFLGTLLFFRESPVAIVAISQMAAGDGLADIMGRKFGRVKWPFSRTKSIVGTFSFFVGGFLCSFLGLWWMKYTGFLHIDLTSALLPTLLISAVSAIIELFPIVDDNISVPLVAALLSYLWLVPL